MSYAAPLFYAAKTLTHDPHSAAVASHHSRPLRQRRRRIRMALLPALHPRRGRSAAPTAMTAGSGSSR